MGEGPKIDVWNKFIPTNTYTITNSHGSPVSRDKSSTDSRNIAVAVTAGE